MKNCHAVILACLMPFVLGGCEQPQTTSTESYETSPVILRTIDILVEAAGVVEPETTIEVKSKASGEILFLDVETGDPVEEDTLIVQIDKRAPGNLVNQSQADLEAAKARRKIAQTQLERSQNLLDKGIVTKSEFETAQLELADADAMVVSRQVELENARIALEDTDVRAPISGIVIEKNVERGQVISSPTRDVGGGTILLKMANLDTVRVRTLVDEVDIGKITPGMEATVSVSAYPNRPFVGRVLKIEPQATVDQNVTMFPVLIRLENPDRWLKPGMNAEVEISIARAENVLSVPTMALRTQRDLATTAVILGIGTEELKDRINSSRQTLNASEAGDSSSDTRPGRRGDNDYWVVVGDNNNLTPRAVKTGLTDLEYTEIIGGLKQDERILILPSSGLLERQEKMQNTLNQRMRPPGM